MFTDMYFNEVLAIADNLDKNTIEEIVENLHWCRTHEGRVFVLGIGGSAGNASHMVNDLRKLCNIEAYAPTDNVSEITARSNDEGFDTIFSEYLKISRLNHSDIVFILSVGGGNKEKNVSTALVNAIDHAKTVGSTIIGLVGRNDGYTAEKAHLCVVVPTPEKKRITPHAEEFQTIIWHCIVSNPRLQANSTKW